MIKFLNLPLYEGVILKGILEITMGLKSLSILNINDIYKVVISSMFLSFGGLSIHTQIKSILPDTNYKLFLKNKFLSILISITLLLLFHSMKLL